MSLRAREARCRPLARRRRDRRGNRVPAPGPRRLLQRNTVERAFNFNQLRHHRAVATRYDKRNFIWGGTIDVASTGSGSPPQSMI